MVMGQYLERFRNIFIISFILSSVVLSGCCTQTIKHYSGPELPSNEVATLHIPHSSIKVELDGEPVGYYLHRPDTICGWYEAEGEGIGADVYIKMLPRKHNIKWSWRFKARDFDMNFTFTGEGTLDAKAGKTYLVQFAFNHGERETASPRLDYDYIDYDVVVYMRPYNTVEIVKVKDYAIWIEEIVPFGKNEVVVGNKPNWVKR